MKILALIPARGGSKGVPRKNVKMLGGKALIRYAIEAGLQCPTITQVVVSTDDEEIAEVSRQAGADVPFLRPAELATDTSPTLDTVIHALRFLEDQGLTFDALCLLQPTTPFRSVADIEQAIATFQELDADSLVSVRPVPHSFNPHWVFEADSQTGFLKIATGEKRIITRRQELPPAYFRDGAIYLTKTKVILEQNSLYGESIAYHVMTNSLEVNIDTLADWEKAELAAKDWNKQYGAE